MFDYLQKFNKLPQDLRTKISSPAIMAIVSELEARYQVDLAMTIMKVMIKNLTLKNLPAYFVSEFNLRVDQAEALSSELKTKIFVVASDYLGLSSEIRAFDLERDITFLIKEAGLTLSSEILIKRLKNILSTYIRGIRSKIDTRATLAKDAKIGGLNLNSEEIDRVLKVCDNHKFSSRETAGAAGLVNSAGSFTPVLNRVEEYDLKSALTSGHTKSLSPTGPIVNGVAPTPFRPALAKESVPAKTKLINRLDLSHELSGPSFQLDLPEAAAKASLVGPLMAKGPAVTAPTIPTPPTPVKPRFFSFPSKPAAINPATQQKSDLIKPNQVKVSSVSITQAPTASPIIKDIVPPPLAKRQAPVPVSGRPQMHDIKPMPKIIGPLEELQFLDLVNFRRLGQNPSESTDKVLAKVKLLERDGYDKMVLGVRAWRQSPVNRSYIRLGQEAIAKGTSLKAYVVSQKEAGKDCLSLEEIETIVKLNSQLIF